MQTAKQYGNLGRLFQTTKMFKWSEQMHLKAIKLKEALLGKDDYEVGLSLGHLASLYAYDMKEYRKAEELYLRSIKISINLFGLAYSGLHADYYGLLQVDSHFNLSTLIFDVSPTAQVYERTNNVEKANHLAATLDRWQLLMLERKAMEEKRAKDHEKKANQDKAEERPPPTPSLFQLIRILVNPSDAQQSTK